MQDSSSEPLEKRLQELNWYDATRRRRARLCVHDGYAEGQHAASLVQESSISPQKLGDEARNLPSGCSPFVTMNTRT